MEDAVLKKSVADFFGAQSKVLESVIGRSFVSVESTRNWLRNLGAMLNLLTLPEDSRILDVATGFGFVSIFLCRKFRNVIGFDIARPMLELARKYHRTLAQPKQDLHLLLSDAENLPFPDQTFDGVTCQRVIHFLPNQSGGLSEIQRVLAKRGQFLIGNEVMPELKEDAVFVHELFSSLRKSFNRFPRLSELRSLLSQGGFTIESEVVMPLPLNIHDHLLIWTPLAFTDISKLENTIHFVKDSFSEQPDAIRKRLLYDGESFTLPYAIMSCVKG